ncbi:histidine phosphatase family protein [Paracoccus tibetensis]|uniref:Probable phosphoglycerate mutase n=1 Tax=Paracoccus tibetensis TaxID=336292 RepID=A0A1G5FNK6_9RHOB|nr:histidine phosphatase family protein [Paracoccus tibetensis]SCY40826.1 probable phosphoglycerate mutase [Paracoccus tibetensis]
MLPDLYLIRHGETRWNREGRLQGRLDSPLTAQGRAQALALADLVRALPGTRFSSPQGRAVATARLLFGAAGFRTDARLAEVDVGAFTGCAMSDLHIAHPALFAERGLGWYDRCPGGEGFAALAARCRSFLSELQGPALLVGHGITLRMIWAVATEAGVARLHEAPLAQGAVLAVRDGRSLLLEPPNGLANGGGFAL